MADKNIATALFAALATSVRPTALNRVLPRAFLIAGAVMLIGLVVGCRGGPAEEPIDASPDGGDDTVRPDVGSDTVPPDAGSDTVPPDAGDGTVPVDFDSVRRQLEDALQEGRIKGLGLTLFDRRGELVFEFEGGAFDNQKLVPIASATKWVTAAVVLTLVRDELLHLSTTTREVFGWQGSQGEVTVAQLLSFTSGFRKQSACVSPAPTVDDDGNVVPPADEVSLVDCAQQIYLEAGGGTVSRETRSQFVPPSTDIFSYNGKHMVILGAMAEAVTGKSWPDLYEERVRAPMGLDERMAYGSNRLGGSLVASVDAYSEFMRRLFADTTLSEYQETRLFPAELIDRSLVDQFTPHTTIDVSPYQKLVPPQVLHYGFGTWLQCEDYGRVDMCADTTIALSQGAHGWTPFIDKSGRFFGVLGMHHEGSVAGDAGFIVAKKLFDALHPAVSTTMREVERHHDVL